MTRQDKTCANCGITLDSDAIYCLDCDKIAEYNIAKQSEERMRATITRINANTIQVVIDLPDNYIVPQDFFDTIYNCLPSNLFYQDYHHETLNGEYTGKAILTLSNRIN
jgi:hypothetical protein